MPKVSVIIPNYNHARFLDQRLETVFNQTFTDFEVIFLDDASTDNSLEIFKKYARDKRITQVVLNKTNSGSPFKQWDRGIKLAKGGYIWIAESDDYADPDLLQILVDKLDSYPTAGIAFCQSRAVNESGNALFDLTERFSKGYQHHWENDFLIGGRDEICSYMVRWCTVPNASAALLRKEVFAKTGVVCTELMQCGDWMTWIKMLELSDLCYSAKSLNYCRQSVQSSTSKSLISGRTVMENYVVTDYIIKHHPISRKTRSETYSYLAFQLFSVLMTRKRLYKKRSVMLLQASQYDWLFLLRYLGICTRRLMQRVTRSIEHGMFGKSI